MFFGGLKHQHRELKHLPETALGLHVCSTPVMSGPCEGVTLEGM